jgi:hypothetical protein
MDAHVAHWTVEVYLSEQDGHSHADARLISGVTPALHAVGTARLNENDPADVPEIGYELAAARALRGLADLLLATGEADVAAISDPR